MPALSFALRLARGIGVGVIAASVTLSLGSFAHADEPVNPQATPSATDSPSPTATEPTPAAPTTTTPSPTTPAPGPVTGEQPGLSAPEAAVTAPDGGYGADFPVSTEATFSRPYRALSSKANSDFSILDDMARLIDGTWKDQNTGRSLSPSVAKNNEILISVSRMENAYRVRQNLVTAASKGVKVLFIHGKASQSVESRWLQSKLNAKSMGASNFRICQKGRSLACLSNRNGAIMHTKMLLVNNTYTRAGDKAKGATWSGSANLGGPSGQQTYNNALTVYNDKKLYSQMRELFKDMYTERNVNDDYPAFVAKKAKAYGNSADGYYGAKYGMFYSPLSKTTIYPTPIKATPTNGRDPVVNALNRVIPGADCTIRVMHNRFKYRRLFVAHQLEDLESKGCKVSAVAYWDDLKVNRAAHCQLYIRICQPILDVFRRANNRIEVAWAKPHDKTLLIEARMSNNPWNKAELQPNGQPWGANDEPYVKFVQAGSAALTGSNLVVSDEITTETTDEQIYEDYKQHWKSIWKSHEHKDYRY